MNSRFLTGVIAVALMVGPTLSGHARELHMVAPEIPPHFDKEGKGRMADVVRAALGQCGYQVRFTVVPFGRHWKDYADNPTAYDGMATAEADQTFPGHSTKPFMHLQDGATVTSTLANVSSVEQLKGLRVVAFPAADKILGIESQVPTFKSFGMRADRFDQLRPLFAGRADAILADGLITAHFIAALRERAAAGSEPNIDVKTQVVFRKIFGAGPQRLYFADPAVTSAFDRCVEELRSSGELIRIAKPYVDRFRDILGDQYPVD